jgi:hypothetical protein
VHLIDEDLVTSFLTDEDDGKRGWCAQCGVLLKKPQECSACRSVAYCSPQCQKKHWKAVGGHRLECRQIQSAN